MTHAQASSSARYTRDDLVALGRGGDPWTFVALATQALRVLSSDTELRFLLAAAYARLGLRTCAGLQLEMVAPQLAGHPGLVQLRSVVEALPHDEVGMPDRLSIARDNVAKLCARRVPSRTVDELHGAMDRFATQTRQERWFRARGDNVVRMRADGAWIRFADDARHARDAACALSPAPDGDATGVQPVFFEGIEPPWLLLRVAERSPERRDGSATRLTVVCEDAEACVRSLAYADLSTIIDQDRVEWFVGTGSGEGLLRTLRGRFDERLGTLVVTGPIPDARTSATDCEGQPQAGVGAILASAIREQALLLGSLRAEVERRYADRGPAWWKERFARPASDKLRVLIPTSRYSTFVRHASADLADALRAAGCDARLLVEAGATSQFCPLATWRALAEHRPDLIVVVNHTRGQMQLPANVPMVTWIQDRVGALFDAKVGRALGPLDFVAGHLYPELFESFGYPRDRVLPTPVLASDRAFHDRPAEPSLARLYECEVACVSNHSTTPQALGERLVRDAPPSERDVVARLVPELLDGLQHALPRGSGDDAQQPVAMLARVRSLCEALSRRHLGAVSPHSIAAMESTYAMPLAERILRHEVLGWAAEVCDRRRWRLHLYGRGWESHPTLASHARGELSHDEHLRAAYRAARVNLHAGLGGLQHQRVMECALSGGCTLAWIKAEDAWLLEWQAQHEIAEALSREVCAGEDVVAALVRMGRVREDPTFLDGSWVFTPIDAHDASRRVREVYSRLGLPPRHDRSGLQVLSKRQLREPWHDNFGTPVSRDAAWLLGDPSECGFWSRSTFERALTNAVEDHAWRDAVSQHQQAATRAEFTMERFASRVIELVRRGLGVGGGESVLEARGERTGV